MKFFLLIKQTVEYIISPEAIIATIGVFFLGYWLLKTSLGRKALSDSLPRRNNMPAYLPFVPLFVYFGTLPAVVKIAEKIIDDMLEWQKAFVENLVVITGALATIVIIVFLVRASFARRLKGFGLNRRTISKDFGIAAINYLSVWPVVMVMIILTTELGKFVNGPDFKMQPHRELEFITKYPQLPLTISIFVVAVVIAPIFEEMVFRGLFQTMLRSFSGKVWLSIFITSIFFVVTHFNAGHWPALFVLSMAMGYSYEKSGSLFRPIFIHAFFNATSVIATLAQ